MRKISLAKDFSRIPGARFPKEGDYSGEEFRCQFLAPALKFAIENDDSVTVELDGTAGIGTSFLEEAFGGLIRIDKFSLDQITKSLIIISNEVPDYLDEIKEYLNEASEKECD